MNYIRSFIIIIVYLKFEKWRMCFFQLNPSYALLTPGKGFKNSKQGVMAKLHRTNY